MGANSLLVNANVSGVPLSNFSDGSQTFTPPQFLSTYVPQVCEQADPMPICLMLVKRIDDVLQSGPPIVIDGCYSPLP